MKAPPRWGGRTVAAPAGAPRRAARALTALLSVALLGSSCRSSGGAPPPDEPSGTSPTVRKITLPPGMLLDSACSPSGPELCFNAVDDNCNGILDEGCGVRTGLVQFAIAWSDPAADVDLNVTDPLGELAEAGRVTEAGLTKDRDCPGRQGECQGQNMENVFLEAEKSLPRGVYRVRVRLEKLGSDEPPVRVRFGARVGPKSYAAEVALARPEDEAEILFDL